MKINENLTEYLKMTESKQGAFNNPDNCSLTVVTDPDKMVSFEKRTGKSLGVLADNSPFFTLVGDLVDNGKTQFRYCRLIYTADSNGGVCLIHLKEENKFCLLKIFRHANRKEALEFPRGFAEKNDVSISDNIRRELREEMGLTDEIIEIRHLGCCESDSPIIHGRAEVFSAEIERLPEVVREEGITGYEILSENEFIAKLGTEITDNFTITAYCLWKAKCNRIK